MAVCRSRHFSSSTASLRSSDDRKYLNIWLPIIGVIPKRKDLATCIAETILYNRAQEKNQIVSIFDIIRDL